MSTKQLQLSHPHATVMTLALRASFYWGGELKLA